MLSPHHIKERSDLGPDTKDNVITLCIPCHSLVQTHKVLLVGDNAEGTITFEDTTMAKKTKEPKKGGLRCTHCGGKLSYVAGEGLKCLSCGKIAA